MLYNFCIHDFYYPPPTNTRQVADMSFKYRHLSGDPDPCCFSNRILSKHLYALTRVALKASSHCKSSYLCFTDEEPGEAQRCWITCLGLQGFGGSPGLWAHQDRSCMQHIATTHCLTRDCSGCYLASGLGYLDLVPENIYANLLEWGPWE